MTPWEIKAISFGNCNCDYGCPCQFNALPTHGSCEAAVCMRVDEGHYGDTRLDGLHMGGIFWWPGPVHEGKGRCQPLVDQNADEAQRTALLTIMSGGDTAEAATMFWVYSAMCETVFEPVFAEFEFDVDVEARKGRTVVPGILETIGRPIRNPVTGNEHRVRIDLPHGFEYEIAEIGSASTKTSGNVELNLTDSYGQFNHLHLNNHGPVRSRAA